MAAELSNQRGFGPCSLTAQPSGWTWLGACWSC